MIVLQPHSPIGPPSSELGGMHMSNRPRTQGRQHWKGTTESADNAAFRLYHITAPPRASNRTCRLHPMHATNTQVCWQHTMAGTLEGAAIGRLSAWKGASKRSRGCFQTPAAWQLQPMGLHPPAANNQQPTASERDNPWAACLSFQQYNSTARKPLSMTMKSCKRCTRVLQVRACQLIPAPHIQPPDTCTCQRLTALTAVASSTCCAVIQQPQACRTHKVLRCGQTDGPRCSEASNTSHPYPTDARHCRCDLQHLLQQAGWK